MTLVNTLAGIAWDPQIRGILSVGVGVAVLMGSVYLMLATNVAHRLGFLLAFTAFFGWMTIHGFVWWLYPPIMGPAGRVPSWEVEEVVRGDLSNAILDDARSLELSGLPDSEQVDEATAEQIDEISGQHADDLSDWELLSAADPSRAEAQASVDAVLAEGTVTGLSTPETYIHQYVLEVGGKPERESDGVFDRVANKISNTLRLTHPPHYALVQVQPTIEQTPEVGQPPPTPEPDPDAEPVSVILQRDLGQRRLPAALISSGSAMIFGLLCVMLHQRDKRVAQNRSAPLPATTSLTTTTTGG